MVCHTQEFFVQGVIQSWVGLTDHTQHIISSLEYHHPFGRMMRMREHGLQERENARLYTQKPKCGGSGGNFVTASLVDTKPAMLVLAWGMLFSFIMFGIEMLIVHFKRKTSTHTPNNKNDMNRIRSRICFNIRA